MPRTGTIDYVALHLDGAVVELGWKPRKPPRERDRPVTWLPVHGRVECPQGSWSFRDESLLYEEAIRLADWLSTLDVSAPASLKFVEPCLAFAAAPIDHVDCVQLSVTFRGEASPPWLHGHHEVWESGFTIAGRIGTKSRQSVAASIRRLLD